jgi:glutathione synthase/RimK-type ligase-like ATP-grasp enzyme
MFMSKLVIGIMMSRPKPFHEYEREQNSDIVLFLFNREGINWSRKKIKGLMLTKNGWKEVTRPFPLAVYNRYYTTKSRILDRIERVIGKHKVFNSVTRFDKWENYTILRSSEVRECIPSTYLYHKISLISLLEEKKVLILKPCKGSLGNKVYLLNTTEDNEFQISEQTYTPRYRTTDRKEFQLEVRKLVGLKKFILQQYIDLDKMNEHTYDIRIVVQKNIDGKWEISGGYSRIALKNYYVTNAHRKVISITELIEGNNKITEEIYQEMGKICLLAAKSMEKGIGHLGEIGVDFGLDYKGNLWIIEINGKPQKSVFNKLKSDELSKTVHIRPIEYARYLIHK